MKKFKILAAIFILFFSISIPDFAVAKDNPQTNEYIEKVLGTVQTKKNYKNRLQPILIPGATNIEIVVAKNPT